MKERTLPRALLLSPTDAGLAIARSLARRGVEVQMLVENGNSWIGETRWAKSHMVGLLPEHADAWIEKLAELGELGDGVLLSGSDRTTDLLVRRRAEIPANLLSFESPESAHLRLMDKASLYEIAKAAGVRHPRTLLLEERSQLDGVVAEAAFPSLIKPVHSHLWRSVMSERRAIVVDGPEQLVREVEPALEADLAMLVCEHIPGPDINLEGVTSVHRVDGSFAIAYGRRKVRMQPPGYGAAAIMESVPVPEAFEMTRALLGAAGFAGVSSTEFKRHAETDELHLIEVNVRVPQAWGLAEAAGTDGSWRLYATLAGVPLDPQPEPRLGVRCVIPSLELRAAPTHLAEGKLTLRGVLAGYRRVRGFSGLTWRDPKPILCLGWTQLKWVLGHLTRRLLRREP